MAHHLIVYILSHKKYMYTWGNLPKSQSDSETIEECIARLIAEHNNKPTAHNDPGQALDLHRKDTIIDHPAGSVKNDKYSFHTYDYNIQFADFAYWTKSLFSLNSYDMTAYASISTTNLNAYLMRELPITSQLNFANASFIYSCDISLDLGSHSNNYFYLGIGGYYDLDSADYGFKFKNHKSYVTYYDSVSSSVVEQEITNNSVNDLEFHSLRIEKIVSENIVNFYIDENKVYTVDWTGWASDSFLISRAKRNNSSAGYIDVRIFNPVLSLDYTY